MQSSAIVFTFITFKCCGRVNLHVCLVGDEEMEELMTSLWLRR